MKRFKPVNRVVSIGLAVTMVALVSACGAQNSASSPGKASNKTGQKKVATRPTGNTLMWGQNWGDVWVKSLDPAIITDTLSINMVYLVQANLVKLDYPSLKVVPDLATWKVASNHKTWTFTIRKNAKFSNGDPVTAEDAAWSITRSLLPSTKSPVALTYLGDVVGANAVAKGKSKTLSGVKVLGQRKLQITLDKPIAYFLGTLSYPTADVLDKKVMQGVSSSDLTNTCSLNVGAGPFEFVCRNKSHGKSSFYPSGTSPYMMFKPNPNYYGAKPHIKIKAPFFNQDADLFKAYEAGEVDFTPVPAQDTAKAKKMQGFTKQPALVTDYITPNQRMKPFNNIHCRLAVAYAIDRAPITEKLMQGTEGPLYDVVPPHLLSYFANPKKNGVPYYNPTRAKAELAKCPGGINVNMPYQHTSPTIINEYDAIRANLAAIGAHVTMQPKTFNAWLTVVTQSLNATHTPITENLWLDDYPDPQDWLDNLLHSGTNYNIGGFHSAKFDKLVDQANVEFNKAKRAKLYQQAAEIALRDGAWIGVGYQNSQFVIGPRVHGMIVSNAYVWPKHDDWSKVSLS